MLKAGTETGSLTNHVMSYDRTTPVVGMGATILCWTDRHAATVVKVTRTQCHVRRDKATRADANGMSETQSYTYAPDPSQSVELFRLTKNGWRNSSGNGLLIGHREEYYDFSF
jgi:hypothetical protein